MLSVKYDGQAVAVLPFTPLRFLQRITARGLDGRPQNECCLHFFYILCSMALKPNISKLLGHEPPRSATLDTEAAKGECTAAGCRHLKRPPQVRVPRVQVVRNLDARPLPKPMADCGGVG